MVLLGGDGVQEIGRGGGDVRPLDEEVPRRRVEEDQLEQVVRRTRSPASSAAPRSLAERTFITGSQSRTGTPCQPSMSCRRHGLASAVPRMSLLSMEANVGRIGPEQGGRGTPTHQGP